MLNFKDFSDVLLENLTNFKGSYPNFIDYGPNLFNLLCDLLNQEEISSNERLIINAAIAYYVVPMDIIPEEIYGPYGYIDDIFITVYVLKKIANSRGYDFLQNLWKLDEDIIYVIDVCYNGSLELLGDKINDILIYVGLID